MADNKKAEVKITGMTCAGCAGAVEKSLKALGGVSTAKIDLATKMVFVNYDAGKLTLILVA
jgi:P-type Cu+ transporter